MDCDALWSSFFTTTEHYLAMSLIHHFMVTGAPEEGEEQQSLASGSKPSAPATAATATAIHITASAAGPGAAAPAAPGSSAADPATHAGNGNGASAVSGAGGAASGAAAKAGVPVYQNPLFKSSRESTKSSALEGAGSMPMAAGNKDGEGVGVDDVEIETVGLVGRQ